MTVVAYYLNGKIQTTSQKVTERRLKEGFYLCGNAKLDAEGVIGDPTEVALMRWALDNGRRRRADHPAVPARCRDSV